MRLLAKTMRALSVQCHYFNDLFLFQIEWSISRLNKHGYLSLHDVTLDADMIASLEHCPVEWVVTIDGAVDDVINVTLGQTVDVAMSVRSGFGFEISGEFRVECYFQGQRCSDVSDALIIVTQCESESQTCSPGALLSHTSCLLPLAAGCYDLVITCNLEKTGSSFRNETPFSFRSKYPKINIVVNDDVKLRH